MAHYKVVQNNTMNKKAIVITTINSPNESIRKFGNIENWNSIIIGDNKTPLPWEFKNSTYLGIEQQNKLPYAIIKNLPFNHYCRKMIGYVHAMEYGAEIIYDTDDDNIPYDYWHLLPFEGSFEVTNKDIGFVNVYKSFTKEKIWPRGYPLELVLDSFRATETKSMQCSIGVWQGLANQEPDVDAVYRLTINKQVEFERRDPMVLNKGAVCPFNSQNTFFRKELFALLYLPAFVSFRFTDILRGFIAQSIMWQQNYLLGFFEATVFQERNPHNFLIDFKQEIECYLLAQQLPVLIGEAIRKEDSVENNLHHVYANLLKKNIVQSQEMHLLEQWLTDVSKFKNI